MDHLVISHANLEAVHAGLGLHGDGGGWGEGEGWRGGRGGGCRGSLEEGVDSDGGHVVGVLVLNSAGRGALRTRQRDGLCSLRTDRWIL